MNHVLVVTHGTFGAALLEAASQIVGRQEGVEALGLPLREGADDLTRWVGEALVRAQTASGLLILVDFPGGTPDNVSRRAAQGRNVAVVAGLNLSMLIHAISRREENLKTLAEGCQKAAQGGVRVSALPQ